MSGAVTMASGGGSYADLRARVSLGPVDQQVLDELPGLYSSLFATAAWFQVYDRKAPNGVCELDDPRHVLAFHVDGDTADVLNKAFAIDPADARRACLAIFRALPTVRRIHLEVLFPPGELRAPKRWLIAAEDQVIDLPGDADAYAASLGKRTRKNLRNYDNKLRRAYPDVSTSTFVPSAGEIPVLADQVIEWNVARMTAQGIVSGFVKHPERRQQLYDLLAAAGGEAQVTSIAGRPAAIEFTFYVGEDATIYVGAFDEAYEDVHLGLLSTYWAVREAARRGARRCHLLWTTTSYKQRLGASPVTATRLSLFRTPLGRFWSLREARDVHWREVRRSARRRYWDARHAARRAAERTHLLGRDGHAKEGEQA